MAGVSASDARTWFACAAASLCFISCAPAPAQPPDRIVLWQGSPWHGRSGVDLRREGGSRYQVDAIGEEPVVGNLTLSAARFDEIAGELAKYEARSLPVTLENIDRRWCAPGQSYVTDAGILGITWHRGRQQKFAVIDFGCAKEMNREEYRRLRSIIAEFNLPEIGAPERTP
jgi:hypothetical protein